MKILHTSDLHIGRTLMDASLYDDQKHILSEIIKITEKEKADVLLISGDIYDKSIPSGEAVKLFNDFLNDLAHLDCEVLIIRGNHDSLDRLNFGSRLFDRLNIHIVSEYEGRISVFRKGNVDFYMLPYVKPFYIRDFMSPEEYETVKNSNDMMKWILSRENIDKTRKNVLLLHQFVIANNKAPELSESESVLNVGSLDPIDAALLKDFDYVALGHIHKPQKVGRETVRYSGTPMKYSFSEVNNHNGMVLYDSETDEIRLIELKPIREMRVIRDSYENILKMEGSNDLLRIELTDEPEVSNPLDNIRKIFPNVLLMVPKRHLMEAKGIFADRREITASDTPLSLFEEFYRRQSGRELNETETEYLNSLFEKLKENGNAY